LRHGVATLLVSSLPPSVAVRLPWRGAAVVAAPPPLPTSASALSSAHQIEVNAYVEGYGGDSEAAMAALESKQRWLADLSPLRVPQEFYRSEGYTVALEGLCDNAGNPLVFANGAPHGTSDEVVRQVVYTHERVVAQCIANNRTTLRATTIVNVCNPTFRFPDVPMRTAIAALRDHYPWSTSGKTIFIGMPVPVRWCFELLRSFMSPAQYASIVLADPEELPQHAPLESLPPELGGHALWSLDEYIAERCDAEGSTPTDEVQPYRGKRLDLRAFEELQAEPDGVAAKAVRAWRRLGGGPA